MAEIVKEFCSTFCLRNERHSWALFSLIPRSKQRKFVGIDKYDLAMIRIALSLTAGTRELLSKGIFKQD